MSNIIYVVTSGDYSDYHIDGVFDDPALAELIKNALNNARIEPWELNMMHSKITQGYKFFRVFMDTKGNTPEVGLEKLCREAYNKDVRFLGFGNITHWIFYVWAKDEKHAVKIANERRVQLIAFNQWDLPEPIIP